MIQKIINASLEPPEHSQRICTNEIQNFPLFCSQQQKSVPNKPNHQGHSLANRNFRRLFLHQPLVKQKHYLKSSLIEKLLYTVASCSKTLGLNFLSRPLVQTYQNMNRQRVTNPLNRSPHAHNECSFFQWCFILYQQVKVAHFIDLKWRKHILLCTKQNN